MLNCGAILARSGHLNTSSILNATKGINTQRHVSTITRNKLLRSHLLALEAQSVHTRFTPLSLSHSSYARFLRLRKIYSHLRAQCSSCATDVNKKLDIGEIAKDEICNKNSVDHGLQNQNRNEDVEHRMHKKKHELKFAEIEKLYPNPKGKLGEIFMSICSQLGQENMMTVDYQPPKGKGLWVCTYNLKWPTNVTITAQAASKMAVGKIGAIKCLQYLHNDGRLANGHPAVYDSKVVFDMLRKPTMIDVDPETRGLVKDLLDQYNTEICQLIENASKVEKLRDISLSTEEISDPIGRSLPSNWDSENLKRRNDILRHKLYNRSVKITAPLPIADYRDKIITEIAGNRALLIKGDTGCGKTTQVPQYIFDSYAAEGRATECNMIVSQPRRISAMSLAERIADERDERPGDVVGYQVRLQQVLPTTPGGILFCTTGILLKKMQSNPSLKGCSHVILDEAHERSINTDMLLVLLKRALDTNPQLKVIVMSATINADLFQSYFNCGVVEVPGRTFPVEMHFLEDVEKLGIQPRKRYVGELELPEGPYVDCEQISDLIHWIDKNKPEGAILCFLPGWADIVRVTKGIEARSSRRRNIIIPAHSRMSHQDQRKIFSHPPPGVRKIVLATDIAETGITVTDVVYVVDSATQKTMKWIEKKGLATFGNQYASQANLLQRKGRAGRVQSGESYHMITRPQFQHLPVHPLPEVLRSSLEKTVLDCKTYSDEKAEEFLGSMPEPPTRSAVRKAIEDLRELGALDENENLTSLGKRIALFTVHPTLSKAIVYSVIFQCIAPMMTIATAMSADSEIFTGTLYDKEALRKIKQVFHPSSDHISIGWLYTQWASLRRQGREAIDRFCRSKKLHPERMYTLSKIRDLNAENLVECRMLNDFRDYDNLASNCNEFAELDELVRGVLFSGLDQLLHRRDFDLRNNKVKRGTTVFIMEDGSRATVTPESVNFKRKSWPSPFLTYVRRQHNEERRISLIRETSMISPVTAVLFSQGRIQGFQSTAVDSASDEVILSIRGRKNFRLSCDAELAKMLLQFRDSMWNVVGYFVERQGLVENVPNTDHSKVEDYKERMLQVLAQLLSSAATEIDKPEVTKKENNRFADWDD